MKELNLPFTTQQNPGSENDLYDMNCMKNYTKVLHFANIFIYKKIGLELTKLKSGKRFRNS